MSLPGEALGVFFVVFGALYVAVILFPGGRYEAFFNRLSIRRMVGGTAPPQDNRRRQPGLVLIWGVFLIAFGVVTFATSR